MFTVARPIEGISLNGLEYLLDEDTGQPRVFPTLELAVLFLQANGFGHMSDIEIQDAFTITEIKDGPILHSDDNHGQQ